MRVAALVARGCAARGSSGYSMSNTDNGYHATGRGSRGASGPSSEHPQGALSASQRAKVHTPKSIYRTPQLQSSLYQECAFMSLISGGGAMSGAGSSAVRPDPAGAGTRTYPSTADPPRRYHAAYPSAPVLRGVRY